MSIKFVPTSQVRMALDLIWCVFIEFVAPGYTKQGVEEFKQFIDYSYNDMVDKVDRGEFNFLGYYHSGKLVGVLGFENRPHISLLYVHKDYHKHGFARALIENFEEYCKQNFSKSTLTLNASPYAHKIYTKLGFNYTDDEQTVRGMRFYPMEKVLE